VRALCLVLLALAAPSAAQTPPVAPDVVARDGAGRATIRAVRLAVPLRVDGALDEDLYTEVPPVSDFVQIEPRVGAAATEQTQVWLSFDDVHVYVSFRALDSEPRTIVATEMRRDNTTMVQGNDFVTFLLDTFHDRQNGVVFGTNALGGKVDGQVTNDRQFSIDFNPVWDVKVARTPDGWTGEAAVPFKSLRYRPGRAQVWGFNLGRMKRSKNEISYLQPMPTGRGIQTVFQASLAATVVGLEAPPAARNLDLKPYVTSSLTSDGTTRPRVANAVDGDVGLDVKYGITQNVAADLTVHTDFAQVEADEQQVNLTRFSLFFPEKREFFLENQGTFSFGGVAATGAAAASGDAPLLFYSRRIGLNDGRTVPLEVGGRVTGRIGRYSFGLIDIGTGEAPAAAARPTNFAVVRVKRDVLRRSSVGVIATGRSAGATGPESNQAYGVDGTFGFYDNLAIATYWARTRSPQRRGDDASWRAQLDYNGDRYGVQAERLAIGDAFDPEVGFVRRDDIRRDFALVRFSPRPRRPQAIRKFFYQASVEYIENGAGRLESREQGGELALEFQNADRVSVTVTDVYEFLPAPFRIAPGITLPIGDYRFETLKLGYNMGQQRTLSANLSAEFGTFYNGTKATLTVARGRAQVTDQFSIEPTWSLNRVDLAEGRFTAHLAGSRVTYTMTPLMFASALVQYNSALNTVSANVRLRWEYRPGSELFVVYNEDRDTRARQFPDQATRALIVKVNRLLRF
jgi:hypothetical protein